MPASPSEAAARIDVFCRVVDNLGDAAVSWRLARQLALEHGAQVRLWIDDPGALARLVPGSAPGERTDEVEVAHWRDDDPRLARPAPEAVADVVLAGFGVEPPAGYRAAMRRRHPVWINVDHLSAEPWVDSAHALPSPKPDGLVEHFWFPGPSPSAGGLLREDDLIARRDAFMADPRKRLAFLASLGVPAGPPQRYASMFCYPDSPVTAVADALAADPGPPWRLLLPDGVQAGIGTHPVVRRVPFVAQRDYDRLLWSCEVNWVRGEDSLVRSLWSARPAVWQAYRQADEAAREAKIAAWTARWCADANPEPAATAALERAQCAWNCAPDPSAAAQVAATMPALLAALPALATAAARATEVAARRPSLSARLWEFITRRL